MRTSEQTMTLIAALVTARQAFTPIRKAAKGQVGREPYMYADLNAILEATVPALLVNGIAILQAIDAESSSLITRIQHAGSGEWVEAAYPLKLDLRPQELGSLITYARRYSLLGLLCVAAEDDDGAEATKAKTPAKSKPDQKARDVITNEQVRNLWDTAKRAGWSSTEYKRYLEETVGVASSRDVFATNYDDLLSVFGMPFDPQGDHA